MSPEQDLPNAAQDIVPDYISDIQNHPPTDFEDPHVKVVRLAIEQSGIIPSMIEKNPRFEKVLTDFLVGDKSILVIGGESGMGKSLIAADIRKLHQDLGHVLPPQQQKGLAVISWDRTHAAFYEEVRAAAGWTVPLPDGETPMRGRKIVSHVLGDQISYLKKYVDPEMRILIETPLIGTRGETVFDELGKYRGEVQTVITHSPALRDEVYKKGRDMATSGQRASMDEIRAGLMLRIIGPQTHPLSKDAQDMVIKNWWNEQVHFWGGLVLEWDPNDNREGYTNSVALFRANGIRPDHLAPRVLGYATRNQFESIFRAIPDMDEFLKEMTK